MSNNRIIKYLNEENNEIFEFEPLKKYLENLNLSNCRLIPFTNDRIERYRRIDLKFKLDSISLEFIKSSPNLELFLIKKYNDEHIMQEEICFIHELTKDDIIYNNCIINYTSTKKEDNIEIVKTEYYYKNNNFINKSQEKKVISEECLQDIFVEHIKRLNPEGKESHYLNNDIEIPELERKFVTLSGIYSNIQSELQKNNKKTKKKGKCRK